MDVLFYRNAKSLTNTQFHQLNKNNSQCFNAVNFHFDSLTYIVLLSTGSYKAIIWGECTMILNEYCLSVTVYLTIQSSSERLNVSLFREPRKKGFKNTPESYHDVLDSNLNKTKTYVQKK